MTSEKDRLIDLSHELARAIAERDGEKLEEILIELSGLRVRFADDVAVVVGIQKANVELEDSGAVSSVGSFTDVFRRVDGRWRLWLAHSTELRA